MAPDRLGWYIGASAVARHQWHHYSRHHDTWTGRAPWRVRGLHDVLMMLVGAAAVGVAWLVGTRVIAPLIAVLLLSKID